MPQVPFTKALYCPIHIAVLLLQCIHPIHLMVPWSSFLLLSSFSSYLTPIIFMILVRSSIFQYLPFWDTVNCFLVNLILGKSHVPMIWSPPWVMEFIYSGEGERLWDVTIALTNLSLEFLSPLSIQQELKYPAMILTFKPSITPTTPIHKPYHELPPPLHSVLHNYFDDHHYCWGLAST